MNSKLTLTETVELITEKNNEEKIKFFEIFLSQLTVSNRVIWCDSKTSDQTKVDTYKWSNELANRVCNIILDLRREEWLDTGNKFADHITYYLTQSPELGKDMPWTINSSIEIFKHQSQ